MDTLNNLIGTLKWISGAVCAVIIAISIFSIMVNGGDEGTTHRYIARIRNALIALILILLIGQITNLVTSDRYFNDSSSSALGIGDFSDVSTEVGFSDNAMYAANYSNEVRTVFSYAEDEYIIDGSKEVNLGKNLSIWGKGQYLKNCYLVKSCTSKINGTAKVGGLTYYIVDNTYLLEKSVKGSVYSDDELEGVAVGTIADCKLIHQGNVSLGFGESNSSMGGR